MPRYRADRSRGWRPPAALIALALALAPAGCGGPAAAPPSDTPGGAGASGSAAGRPKLMFITNGNSDWWTAVETGMKDAAKEFGCDVEMRRNEKEVAGQMTLLEQALSLPDVQGIAISIYEATAPGVADKLRELKSSGKVVITVDSDIAPESADLRRAYVGTNNKLAGIAAGKAAAALQPEGGRTCLFVGTPSAANAIERSEGFFEGAGPKFQTPPPETFGDSNDYSRAASNVQTAISKYKDLSTLVGLWSYNAPKIAQEVGDSPDVRKKVKVVTFDLDEQAVGHLEGGRIDVSVCQNPYEMGYQGVKLLKALIQKDDATVAAVLPDGKTRDTGVRVIVPKADSPVKGENVITIEEMKKWLASKGLKSS